MREDDDSLRGGPDDDSLNGGDGTDELDGALGADSLAGGPGFADRVSYADRTAAVNATLGDGPNDGEVGEGDDIAADVEYLTGGAGDDTLATGAGSNVLVGGDGNDTIDAGADGD